MESIDDKTWSTYQDPSGFSLKHPPGWKPSRHRSGAAMVASPHGNAFALIQEMPQPVKGKESEIVLQGRFPAAGLLSQGQPGPVENQQPGFASCYVKFKFPDSAPGLALVACEMFAKGALVSVCAARESTGLDKVAAVLWQIKRSYSGDKIRGFTDCQVSLMRDRPNPPLKFDPKPAAAKAGPRPMPGQGGPPQKAGLSFIRFTEPQMKTFQIDIPLGWKYRGGFLHPGLGDRRMCVDVLSPENILVLFGDPDCPQIFYHNPMAWGENVIAYPSGCSFLNLAASGKKLAAYYLKNVAPKRFGPIKIVNERDRKDLAAGSKRAHPEMASLTLTAHEVTFRAGDRSGRCLAFSHSNGGTFVGDNWMGNVVVWLAPPGMEAVGEQVATRMLESFQILPPFHQIMGRDEAMIAANGNAAVMGQQQWFAGQQRAHFIQEQVGNLIMDQYWEQQRVYDGVFQRGGDAMLGRERLYDDVMRQEYFAPAGANYYWVDPVNGAVVGTDTDTPPDYYRDYRLLKRG